MNTIINVTKSSMPDIMDYLDEIRPIFDNHILTNMGPVYKKFKSLLREELAVDNLSLFVNGHMALEMAIDALGLKQKGELLGGGEVITTPFTFASTTHAITRNNLKPVFCDIKPTDYTMNPDMIEALITDKTVAIIPVHVYGNVCDVEKIQEIADRHGLVVIYDAAHAFGVSYKGKSIAKYGDASMFSFHATKVFNSIEGGAVVYKEKKYRSNLHKLKNFGIDKGSDIELVGANAKLNEFAAAMGICNLRRLHLCLEKRRVLHQRYYERLSNLLGIRLVTAQAEVTPNYAYMPVYFDKDVFGVTRDEVCERLKESNIFSRKYFYPAINNFSCYKKYRTTATPISDDASLNILCLPLYEELTLEDVDRICDIIIKSGKGTIGQVHVTYNVNGIDGLCVIEPTVHGDSRGYFMETYNQKDLDALGIHTAFVQDNESSSGKGVLRGLHFQKEYPQSKLVRVVAGRAFDVAIDIRPGSRTYGKWYGLELSAENKKQFLIPKGFAHGFLALSDNVRFCYKCDDFYHPNDEGGIAWNDPEIGITWPGVVGVYDGTASMSPYTMEDGTPITGTDKDQKWSKLREISFDI